MFLLRLDNLVYFSGRAVLLIRNPYRAILSAFKHQVDRQTGPLKVRDDVCGSALLCHKVKAQSNQSQLLWVFPTLYLCVFMASNRSRTAPHKGLRVPLSWIFMA